MDEFGGHWIESFMGGKFHFLDPQPDEIKIVDIAHALSLTCRFGGSCRVFYSVAEHSIRVAEILPEKYKLLGLLHDASEAYLPDLPRPIKAGMPEFKAMENVILQAVFRKYGIDPMLTSDGVVKEADNILLATEARDLMDNTDDWATLPFPLSDKIIPFCSEWIEEKFLERFNEYIKRIQLSYSIY